MANREKLQAGNNTIEADGEFADGYYNGRHYYYDTNSQLPRSLTSGAVSAFMVDNLLNQQESIRWNAGFVCGWMAALCENNPACFFTSIVIPESVAVIALQEA